MGFDKIKNSKEPGHTVTIRSRWNQVWMVLSWPISGINQRPSGLQRVWGSLLWLHPLQQSLSSRLGQAPFIMAAVRGGPWLLVSQMLGFLLKPGSTFTNSLLGSLHRSTSPSVMRLEPAEVASSLRDCFSWSLTQCLALAAFPKPFNAIKIKYHLGDLGYQVWLPVWGETTLATSEIQLLCIKSENLQKASTWMLVSSPSNQKDFQCKK